MIKNSQFTHQKRTLEVRATVLDNEIKVRVFENGTVATPVTYTTTVETVFDAQMSGFPTAMIDELMRLAEEDVVEGRVPLVATSN